MKRIKYLIMISFTLTLFACNDIVEKDYYLGLQNKPSNGTPVIDRIVLASDIDFEISGADFEQVIKIEGKNLGNVKSIHFNDVEVDEKEIYATYDNIFVPVPRVLPANVTDELSITTTKGVLTLPFTVSVPSLRIDGLKNEFAQPGDTTSIIGDNFDLYGITVEEGDIRLGDMFVNMLDATRSELRIQIPANATPNSIISIMSPQISAPIEVRYMEEGFKIFDLENNWPGEGAYTHSANYPGAPLSFLGDGTLEGQPAPLMPGRKYIRFNFEVIEWDWMIFWAGSIQVPLEVAADLSAYDFRFEICTHPKYALGTTSRFLFGDYAWYPAASGLPLNTYGGWETVRISADSPSMLLNLVPGVNTTFKIVLSPESTQEFDVSLCNFRFVRK